ncbi:polysaccharide deacetylase family protein [Clostridium perfringens]|uniref:polysaccharide deacetylase family protein n=1 Tax=Clostridium perfringens TaxID=1502 RepID=UPI0032D9EA17
MKKNIKNIALVLLIIFVVALIVITFKIIKFRKNTVTDIKACGNKITFNSNVKREEIEYLKVDGEKDRPVNKVEGLNLFTNNSKVNLSDKIYEKNLRYYISLEDLEKNGQVSIDGNKILSKINKNYIDLEKKEILKEKDKLDLRGEVLDLDHKKYISINDFKELIEARDDWYENKNSIYMFQGKTNNINCNYKVNEGKAALIRIEDVSAGGVFSEDNNMEKMKYLSDYFKANNIVFHIAWIPRYINPEKNIDNDLLKNNNFENVHFINMLDHLINRGAVIGLHGYTHQHNNQISGLGVELKWNVNSNKNKVLKVVESSLKTAKTLNIPIGFFESPHYKADRNQQKIIEQYFPVMFEPYAGYWNLNPLISFSNKSTLYVPAPLGYVKDNGETVARRIRNYSNEILTAFFIHPYIFLGSIENKNNSLNNEEIYEFNENSPILKIISALKERGCKTINVNELNNQIT